MIKSTLLKGIKVLTRILFMIRMKSVSCLNLIGHLKYSSNILIIMHIIYSNWGEKEKWLFANCEYVLLIINQKGDIPLYGIWTHNKSK